ncbi:MAG: APC family permease [Planctomycetes bacterium]|nr:APC family permease [Planctomycetota bacterium]
MEPTPTFFERVRRLVVGRAKSVEDQGLFHSLSLIAFFAWVGLGADGLSSSCYGPEEAFLNLHDYPHLILFVGLGTVVTIFIISTSYKQIIQLFPTGGGGYLVATKLLSPGLGALSGCALLVDYVLTIAISVASGCDAAFSFFDPKWQAYKFLVALIGVLMLSLLNLRGVKESVIPLVPVFLAFLITHVFGIFYAIFDHPMTVATVVENTGGDIRAASSGSWGVFGLFIILLKAYSMGAGTYTGIEAVSNGVQMLREPRVKTAKRTMNYMATSLALTVVGLMTAYLLYDVKAQPGMTLNAVLFKTMSDRWEMPWVANIFMFITLGSAALLLGIAAQAGFMDGPRVAANMALDSWLPKRFASLSDRFVTQNGVLVMGGAAAFVLFMAHLIDPAGIVKFLVILYSINVFITFSLSQTGMVKHWWQVRREEAGWFSKFVINGVGLALSIGILVSIVAIKFHEGGWVTLVVTGAFVGVVFLIRRHYRQTAVVLRRLDGLVRVARAAAPMQPATAGAPVFDPNGRTAVLLVNGFSGVGLHTLFTVVRLFSGIFKNFVFVQIGAIDAGVFKGADEIDHLRTKVAEEVKQYVEFMQQNGYYAECYSAIGVDIVEEAVELAPTIQEKFPQAIFFGGQLVFPNDSWMIRMLHNYTVFALQRKFYLRGVPFMILPIRV